MIIYVYVISPVEGKNIIDHHSDSATGSQINSYSEGQKLSMRLLHFALQMLLYLIHLLPEPKKVSNVRLPFNWATCQKPRLAESLDNF